MPNKKKKVTAKEQLTEDHSVKQALAPCVCGHPLCEHESQGIKKCGICKCPKFFKDEPKEFSSELPGTPERDEVGQAAHNVLLAEKDLAGAEMGVELARKALIKIMKAYGRESVKIEGRKFTRRFYQSKETVVVSKG